MDGATIPAVAAVANTPAMDDDYRFVVSPQSGDYDHDDDATTDALPNWNTEVARLQVLIDAGMADDAEEQDKADGAEAKMDVMAMFAVYACDPEPDNQGEAMDATCMKRLYAASTPALMDGSPGSGAMDTMTDPSYFQLEIGYNFGDTTVAATWYKSSDFMGDGSEGTAIGIGATHVIGKTGASVFAAARKYDADNAAGMKAVDTSVFLLGTVVTF
jgi:hypothetical protein